MSSPSPRWEAGSAIAAGDALLPGGGQDHVDGVVHGDDAQHFTLVVDDGQGQTRSSSAMAGDTRARHPAGARHLGRASSTSTMRAPGSASRMSRSDTTPRKLPSASSGRGRAAWRWWPGRVGAGSAARLGAVAANAARAGRSSRRRISPAARRAADHPVPGGAWRGCVARLDDLARRSPTRARRCSRSS